MQQIYEQRAQIGVGPVIVRSIAGFCEIQPDERVELQLVVAVPDQAPPQSVEETRIVCSVCLANNLQLLLPSRFPDINLLKRTAQVGGIADRLPLQLGVLVIVLLILSLMDISATRLVEIDRRARDFLVVVDTSRSMREDTALLRGQFPPTFERRADLYVGQSENPASIPNLGR